MFLMPPGADTQGMRIIRILVLAALAAALLTTLPSAVRADEPLRSGTIVSGTGETPVNPWVRGMEGCVGTPTCLAWLQSGCAPALAGSEPALQASIANVEDLADGLTRRSLATGDVGLQGPPLIVQFWTRSDEWDVIDEPAGLDGEGCWELLADRVNGEDCEWWRSDGCTFRIPATAKFMTISANTQNATLTWTLT